MENKKEYVVCIKGTGKQIAEKINAYMRNEYWKVKSITNITRTAIQEVLVVFIEY